MKPYKERLNMIDEAVEKNCGIFPQEYNNPCLLQWRRSGKYCTGTNNYDSGETQFICTRQEFEQRAKELGWINGYQWGVEYETNGEKPDLPDDVLVEYKSKWVGWVKYDDGHDAVENWAWENSTAFKIYDERYKPKEREMKSDWHKKGELPPVGEVVRHKEKRKRR